MAGARKTKSRRPLILTDNVRLWPAGVGELMLTDFPTLQRKSKSWASSLGAHVYTDTICMARREVSLGCSELNMQRTQFR